MADSSDVEEALVQAVGAALYPAGVTVDNQVSGAGCPVIVTRGWPQADQLDPLMLAGAAFVSVRADRGSARLTTRYPRVWTVTEAPAPTLTATVAANTVTFGGTGGAGQVVGLAVGSGVSTAGYAYRVLAGDTPATVAAALAATIPGAELSGAYLIVPGGPVVANVVADVTVMEELRRQEQMFRIATWCPTPELRDALAQTIEPALEQLRFLALPDGSATDILRYRGTIIDDMPQKAQCWRRDYLYMIEYPTTVTQTQNRALFAGVVLAGGTLPLGSSPAVQVGANDPTGAVGGGFILGTSDLSP